MLSRHVTQRRRTTQIWDAFAFRALVWLDMTSGLRRGELAGLRWEDIRFHDLAIMAQAPCGRIILALGMTSRPQQEIDLWIGQYSFRRSLIPRRLLFTDG